MSKRHQRGYIFRKGGFWYLRYYDNVVQEEGSIVRKPLCHQLAEYCDRYRSKASVKPLAEEFLKPLNEGRLGPQSTMAIAEYVEGYYLPHSKAEYRPSTCAGYETLWRAYVASRLTKAHLRDFRCVDATNLLADIHREHGLGRTTLKHVKSLMSGVFTYAKQQGVLDGVNPVKDAAIPKKAQPRKETYATSADEVLSMLAVLQKAKQLKARAAVALAFFTGARPGEARGARWEDYDGKRLMIRQSVWHTFVAEPKTESSKKPVPVIEPLRSILAELREADWNPVSGPILRGPSGKPLNLDNLAKRVIIPVLKDAGIEWHGWYSLRRGIGTLVHSVEKDPMAAKALLRHASVSTTLAHYVKEVPEVTLAAMAKVEALCNQYATGSGRGGLIH